jgi:hypothetical protein
MRPILVTAIALSTHAAAAGPWCGEVSGAWAPTTASLPRHPHLIYFRDHQHYGSKQFSTHLEHVRATIDGKPVKIRVSDVTVGEHQLAVLEVQSERTGKLAISLNQFHGDDYPGEEYATDHERIYQIVSDWKTPVADAPKVTRYHKRSWGMGPRMTHDYDGATIATNLPAIEFDARWRRDALDDWHAMRLPAVADGDHATVSLGETQCGAPTIPLALLERGLELELTAQLPDGTQVAIPLPNPFVLPPAQP